MTKMSWLFASSMFLPALAAAQGNRNYECTNAGDTRRVEVAYPAGGEVPCEVRYYKAGVPEVLWSAANEIGYCAARAQEFVARLRDIGWSCTDGGAAPAVARDDTGVLGVAPGSGARP